ncbi:hypothetical protein [Caulobacter sp. 1776]|uniref:hypothetical protein n=1 Tax=Caulobacter sp. 1776 TaxID=3156420 RepID=UPI003398C846
MPKTPTAAATAADAQDLAPDASPGPGPQMTSEQLVAAAPADQARHLLALRDLPELGALRGQVIRGPHQVLKRRVPAEAARDATPDEISLSSPRHIVLED